MNALELTADRQAVWSQTANTLKSTLDWTRWGTFVLSILGALAATIAGQSFGNLRLGFAVGGTVSLAIGTYLTTRLLGASQVLAWVKARVAAEALKRAAYKYAAGAAPYDVVTTRDGLLNAERNKIEDAVADLTGSLVASRGQGSTPRAPIDPPTYVNRRVMAQADGFYEPKAAGYAKLSRWLGWSELILAGLATTITAVIGVIPKADMQGGFDFVALAAVLTTISGAIVAHVEGSRYSFLITTYRAAARRLHDLAATNPGPFTEGTPAWSDFVDRAETIIAEENGAWLAKWTR